MTQFIRFGTLVLSVFLLSGCLTHWVIDTETRLQITNHTPYSLANLRIVSSNGSEPELGWIEDTLLAGERGRVVTKNMVGKFGFAISARDSLCGQDSCWRTHLLGEQSVEGGSVHWQIRNSGNKLLVESQ